MKELRYVGKNRPYGMIVEIEEKNVHGLLANGEWEDPTAIIQAEVKNGSDKFKSTKRH